MTGRIRTSIEGPRWAGIPKLIKMIAFKCDLKVTELEIDKRLLRETVNFEVRGEDYNLETFRKVLLECIKEYEKG